MGKSGSGQAVGRQGDGVVGGRNPMASGVRLHVCPRTHMSTHTHMLPGAAPTHSKQKHCRNTQCVSSDVAGPSATLMPAASRSRPLSRHHSLMPKGPPLAPVPCRVVTTLLYD